MSADLEPPVERTDLLGFPDEDEPFHLGFGRTHQVILALDEGVGGVHTVVESFLDAAGHGREQVLLAPAQGGELELPVPQVLFARQAGDDGVELSGGGGGQAADVAGQPEQGHVAELPLVAGEHPLGDQL